MTTLAARLLVVMVFTVTTLFGVQALDTGSFQGAELESFLRNAEVTGLKELSRALPVPERRRSNWTHTHTLRFSRPSTCSDPDARGCATAL